jgi:uncharacterized membrane protein YozB (DUF420 family)
LAETTATIESAPPIPAGKLAFAAANSALNAGATVLLVAALVMIKRKRYRAHGTLMVAALSLSAVFLISYLYSKWAYGEVTTGMMGGPSVPGWVKAVYLAVLVPHLIAAIGMLPMIFLAVWHAYRRQWEKHRKIAKPTWFVWFYVSVTGVVVYVMLYHWIPSFRA